MRLIDADALEFYDEIYDEETGEYIQYVTVEQIEASPTVDQVKNGHWVLNGDPRDKWYNCSVCGKHGHDKITNYGCNIETILSDYCPHCGAKMDEKSEK